MEKKFLYEDEVITITFSHANGEFSGEVQGEPLQRNLEKISDTEWIIQDGPARKRAFAVRDSHGNVFVHIDGNHYHFRAVTEDFSADATDAGADGRLAAAMPGKVIKIMVAPGDTVKKNQPVLILESMKMENTQEAPFDGAVVEVNAEEGQQVDAGAVIVRLEPLEPDNT